MALLDWFKPKATDAETVYTASAIPDYKTDANDPYVLNSVTDLIFNKTAFDKRYNYDSTFLERMGSLPVTVFDSLLWEQTAKPIIGSTASAIQNARKQNWGLGATIGAGLQGFGSGSAQAGWNALVNLGETADVVANAVKAPVIEGMYSATQGQTDWGSKTQGNIVEGLKQAYGLNNQGRFQYDYNTGNVLVDLGLEVVSDPLNWVSFGAKEGVEQGAKLAAKQLGASLTDDAAEAVAKTMKNTMLKTGKVDYSAVAEVLKKAGVNDANTLSSMVKALDASLPASFANAYKLYETSEGIQKALFKGALTTSGVTLPVKGFQAGLSTLKDQAARKALRNGGLTIEDWDLIPDLIAKEYPEANELVRKELTQTQQATILQREATQAQQLMQELNQFIRTAQPDPNIVMSRNLYQDFVQAVTQKVDGQPTAFAKFFGKTGPAGYQRKVQNLLASTTDPELRDALLKIKETLTSLKTFERYAEAEQLVAIGDDLLKALQSGERYFINRNWEAVSAALKKLGLHSDLLKGDYEVIIPTLEQHVDLLQKKALKLNNALKTLKTFEDSDDFFQANVKRLLSSDISKDKTFDELLDGRGLVVQPDAFDYAFDGVSLTKKNIKQLVPKIQEAVATLRTVLPEDRDSKISRYLQGSLIKNLREQYAETPERFVNWFVQQMQEQGIQQVTSTTKGADSFIQRAIQSADPRLYSLLDPARRRMVQVTTPEVAKQLDPIYQTLEMLKEYPSEETLEAVIVEYTNMLESLWGRIKNTGNGVLSDTMQPNGYPMPLKDYLQQVYDALPKPQRTYRTGQPVLDIAAADGLKVYQSQETQVGTLLQVMANDNVIKTAQALTNPADPLYKVVQTLENGPELLKVSEAYRASQAVINDVLSLVSEEPGDLTLAQARGILDAMSTKELQALSAFEDPEDYFRQIFDKAEVNASQTGYQKLPTLEAKAKALGIDPGNSHRAIDDAMTTWRVVEEDATLKELGLLTDTTIVFDLETTGLSKTTGRITQIAAINPRTKLRFERYIKTDELPAPSILEKMGMTAEQYLALHNGEGSVTLREALADFLQLIKDTPNAKLLGYNNALFDNPFILQQVYDNQLPMDLVATLEQVQSADVFQSIQDLLGYPRLSNRMKDTIRTLVNKHVEQVRALGADKIFQTIDADYGFNLRKAAGLLSQAPQENVRYIGQLLNTAESIMGVLSARKQANKLAGRVFFKFATDASGKYNPDVVAKWIQDSLNQKAISKGAPLTIEEAEAYRRQLLNALVPEDTNVIAWFDDIFGNHMSYGVRTLTDFTAISDMFGKTVVNAFPDKWEQMTQAARRAQRFMDNTPLANYIRKPEVRQELKTIFPMIQDKLVDTSFYKFLDTTEQPLRDYAMLRQMLYEIESNYKKHPDYQQFIRDNQVYDRRAFFEKLFPNASSSRVFEYAANLTHDAFDAVRVLPSDEQLLRMSNDEFFDAVRQYQKNFHTDQVKAISAVYDSIGASVTGAQHYRARAISMDKYLDSFVNELRSSIAQSFKDVPNKDRVVRTAFEDYSNLLSRAQYNRTVKLLQEDLDGFVSNLYHQAGGTQLIQGAKGLLSDETIQELAARHVTAIETGSPDVLRARYMFMADRDYLDYFKALPKLELPPTFVTAENAEYDALYKVLNKYRKAFEGVGDSLGDQTNKGLFDTLRQYAPTSALPRMITFDDLKHVGWDDVVHYNNSLIGETVADRRMLSPFSALTIARNYTESLRNLAQYTTSVGKMLSLYFNPELVINTSPLFKDMSLPQLQQLLLNHKEYVVAFIDKTGKAVAIDPKNVRLLSQAIDAGAALLPSQSYGKLFKVLNQPEIKNPIFKGLQAISVLYKVGYLGTLGFLGRNLIDGIGKNQITMEDSVNLPRVMKHMWNTWNLYRKYADLVQDMTQYATEQNKRWSKPLLQKFFKEHPDAALDFDTFALIHDFVQDGPSGGITSALQKFLSKGQYSDPTFYSRYYEALNKIPYFSQLSKANDTLEHVMRLSLYLQLREAGSTATDAIHAVTATHFDYDTKTVEQLYTEVLMPFIGFTMKNMEYYMDAAQRWGGFTSFMGDLVNSYLNLDQYHAAEWIDFEAHKRDTSSDLYQSANTGVDLTGSMLYHILAGNFIIESKEDYMEDDRRQLYRVLKISPSMMDAFNFARSPISSITERLLPMFQYPVDKLLQQPTASDYGQFSIKDYILQAAPLIATMNQRAEQSRKSADAWVDVADTGYGLLPSVLGSSYQWKPFDPDKPPKELSQQQRYYYFGRYKALGLDARYNPCDYDQYPQYLPKALNPDKPYVLDLESTDPEVMKHNRWQVADWYAAYKYGKLGAEYNPYRYYPQFTSDYAGPFDPNNRPAQEDVTSAQLKNWYSQYKTQGLPEEYNPYNYYVNPEYLKAAALDPSNLLPASEVTEGMVKTWYGVYKAQKLSAQYNPYRYYPQFSKNKGSVPKSVSNSPLYQATRALYSSGQYQDPVLKLFRQHNQVALVSQALRRRQASTARYRTTHRYGKNLLPSAQGNIPYQTWQYIK